jgi:hypothetical protein
LVFRDTLGYRIDLGVVDPDSPGRYLLGIECDGANYHRARTARDRDKLRAGVLRDLGWKLHRIWSSDWWSDPGREVEKCISAIERARNELDDLPDTELDPNAETRDREMFAASPATFECQVVLAERGQVRMEGDSAILVE